MRIMTSIIVPSTADPSAKETIEDTTKSKKKSEATWFFNVRRASLKFSDIYSIIIAENFIQYLLVRKLQYTV